MSKREHSIAKLFKGFWAYRAKNAREEMSPAASLVDANNLRHSVTLDSSRCLLRLTTSREYTSGSRYEEYCGSRPRTSAE